MCSCGARAIDLRLPGEGANVNLGASRWDGGSLADGKRDYDVFMKRPSPRTEGARRVLALAVLVVPLSMVACALTTEPTANTPVAASGASASPKPVAPVAPVAPPPPATASDVLSRGRAPFDACYTLARTTNPNLPRTSVEMTFSMDDDGKLLNVDFVYRNRMDDAAKDCLRKAAEGLTFPPSFRGKQTGTIVFAPP
jgi:hypothetical protein